MLCCAPAVHPLCVFSRVPVADRTGLGSVLEASACLCFHGCATQERGLRASLAQLLDERIRLCDKLNDAEGGEHTLPLSPAAAPARCVLVVMRLPRLRVQRRRTAAVLFAVVPPRMHRQIRRTKS